MRIFVTGFMGAGKTTVGEVLAAAAGLSFVDLDSVVETEAGLGVGEIFDRLGEAEFRRLETAALESAAALDGVVVATGGGTLLAPHNVELMTASGTVVWLDVPFEVIASRLVADHPSRPLFEGGDAALELFRRRQPIYLQADLRISIGAGDSPADVAAAILTQLESKPSPSQTGSDREALRGRSESPLRPK